MRKVTQDAVWSFYKGKQATHNNTQIKIENGVTKMFLFGNLIAKMEDGKLFITNAGWRTNTTKERLNGLKGVNIYQKKGTWYLNNLPWDGSLIEITA